MLAAQQALNHRARCDRAARRGEYNAAMDKDREGRDRNMPLRLYLIRHGETEWSLSGQHTGRTDISLTVRGEDEAKELALRLQAIPFAHVLTSPRQRARRTCELVGLGPAAEIDPDLAEWDYGDYEGVRSVDIRKTRADWNLFRDGCPNGETPAQVSARADRLIARLRGLEQGPSRCSRTVNSGASWPRDGSDCHWWKRSISRSARRRSAFSAATPITLKCQSSHYGTRPRTKYTTRGHPNPSATNEP